MSPCGDDTGVRMRSRRIYVVPWSSLLWHIRRLLFRWCMVHRDRSSLTHLPRTMVPLRDCNIWRAKRPFHSQPDTHSRGTAACLTAAPRSASLAAGSRPCIRKHSSTSTGWRPRVLPCIGP
ncbi:hypothetical protein BC828DRAFT_269061 [Blastocladiella britannica]|nr:hypothetical protein BC828DRAFT_269061 [Blastocladiella britannica]